MELLISLDGIITYCALLIIAAGYTYWNFWRCITPLIGEIKEAIHVVNQTERDKEAFPAHFYDLKEWMDASLLLKDSWREFEETLLMPGVDFDDDREVILNTRPTGTFFNQRNILRHKVNIRFYNAFPNILTGAGILGTFIGLVVGISLAAPNLNSSSMEDAKEALNILLDGASLAFVTSICGLGTSLVFSWLEKKRVHRFDQCCFTLVSELDARFEYFSAERLANKALEEAKKQSHSMQTFANDLAVTMAGLIETSVTHPMVDAIEQLKKSQQKASDETLERLMKEFSESISGAAGEEMKALGKTLETVNTGLQDQVVALTDGQRELQKNAQQAVKDMMTAVSDGATKMKTEVDNAITDLIAGVKQSVADVTQTLLAAADRSAQQMEQATTQFDTAANKLSTVVEQIGDLEVTTKALADELKLSFERTISVADASKVLADSLTTTTGKLESTAGKILKSSDAVVNASDVIKTYVERLGSLNTELTRLWASYEQRFEGVDTSVSKLFTELQNGLATYAKATNDYVLGLDLHAAKVVQELASATQELSETVDAISDAFDDKTPQGGPLRRGTGDEARA